MKIGKEIGLSGEEIQVFVREEFGKEETKERERELRERKEMNNAL